MAPPHAPQPRPGPGGRPAVRVGRGWRRRLLFGTHGWLTAVIRSARRTAERVCVRDLESRIHDPLVERVQLARTVLGAVATVAMVYVYGTKGSRLGGALDDSIGSVVATLLVLLLGGPLVVAVFVRYAPEEQRRLLRSRLRVPLLSVCWYVLILAAFLAILYAFVGTGLLDHVHGWQSVAVSLFALAFLLWGLPFFGFATYLSVKSAFNTAHVHPVLPALLTSVCVWIVAVFELATEGPPYAPPLVRFASLFGGPLTVTAVSVWEVWRMRKRHGVVVRG